MKWRCDFFSLLIVAICFAALMPVLTQPQPALAAGPFGDPRINADDTAQTITGFCGTGKLVVYKIVNNEGAYLLTVTPRDVANAQAKKDAQIKHNQPVTNQLVVGAKGGEVWLIVNGDLALVDTTTPYRFVFPVTTCGLAPAR